MASGLGLTPEQQRILLQALAQSGDGMANPMAALQNILRAQGGQSAAQAIVAGLRNRLLPAGTSSIGSPAGPAVQAARGLSGAEPTYAQEDKGSGILSEPAPPKPVEKKPDDITDLAKKLADKTPDKPAPTGILADVTVPPVPDVPNAGAAVRSAVGGSLRAAARRGQAAMPSERAGPIAITETITKAALRHGVDPTGLIKTAGIESHFNPRAKNPNSSAGGLFQFIDSTAKSYGLSNKYDAAQSADAAARLWKDNKDSLTRSLGREPTNGELYLAHQQGPAGAAKIIKNPDASVASTVGKSAAHLNAGSGMTNRQFVNMWTRRMGGGSGTPETARQQGALLEEARQPGPAETTAPTELGPPLPPRRPTDINPGDQPLAINVTPSGTETPEPDPDFANITPAEQASLGGDDMGGIGDIGGLLGGLDSGDAGADASADSEPSQLQEWNQEDAAEEKKPEKPLIPEGDKQPSGILSGDSGLLGNQDEKVDLSRIFSPAGMGGAGLFGRDQAPDTSGFKAPVGLPTAGLSGTSPSPTAGILGAPSTGVTNLAPPQLKSIAQAAAAPLPPRRPAGLGAGIDAPTLASPDIPLPPRRPTGLLGAQPSLPALDPDRMQRDAPDSAPPWQNPPGLLGPGMGGPNPPWQDPPTRQQPGLLGAQPGTQPSQPDVGGLFANLTKNAGILSSAFGAAAARPEQPRKRPSGTTSRPIVPPDPLLGSGLLSGARPGIDLNRFFGLLSGRVG